MYRTLFFVSLLSIAVGVKGEIIRGRITDAKTHEPIVEAQIYCTYGINDKGREIRVADEIKVDSLGQFQFRSNTNGTINIRLIGYYPREIQYFASSFNDRDTVNLGNIELKPSELMMKALEVKERHRRFSMKGDTIVFHPEAFHLDKGARLEELIAQLPGVEMSGSNLTFNGKPIRVVMNGERLFGNSDFYRQLPADAVETIKAYNKESEFSERTAKKDGGEDMVLDLNIKKRFLDKFYGDVNTAYQTPRHYKIALDIQKLSNNNPLLIAADANDLNQKIRRSMNSGGIDEGEGNGREQFGAFGFQHNWRRKEDGQTLNSNWSVSGGIAHDDNWNRSRKDIENFFMDDNYNYTMTSAYQRSHLVNPNVEVSYYHAFSPKNTFYFSSKIDYKSQENAEEIHEVRFDEAPNSIIRQTFTFELDSLLQTNMLVHDNTQSNTSMNSSNVKANARWTHYIKDGSLSIAANVNYNKDLQEGQTHRIIEQSSKNGTQKLLHQISHAPTNILTSSLTASGRKWIIENVLLSAKYRIYNSNRHYVQDFIENDVPNTNNSFDDSYNGITHSIDVNSTINFGTIRIKPEVSWQLMNEKEDYQRSYIDTMFTRQTSLWQPLFNTTWKINDKVSLELNYDLSNSKPNLIETIRYQDDSDPLFIRKGNPNLRNTHTNNLSLAINTINSKRQRIMNLKLKLKNSDRAYQQVLEYDPKTSVYTTYPKMVRGSKLGSALCGLDQGLGNEFRIKNSINLEYGRIFGYTTRTDLNEEWMLNKCNSFSTSENLTISYDHIWINYSMFAAIAMNHLNFSVTPQQNTTLWNERVGARLYMEWKRLSISSNLTEYIRHGYLLSSINDNYLIWNADLTWKLPNNKARIKIEINDILNQLDTFNVQQSAYQNIYSWRERMHHYVNISFTYHFDAKGK